MPLISPRALVEGNEWMRANPGVQRHLKNNK